MKFSKYWRSIRPALLLTTTAAMLGGCAITIKKNTHVPHSDAVVTKETKDK